MYSYKREEDRERVDRIHSISKRVLSAQHRALFAKLS